MDSGWRGALRSPSPAQGPRRAGSLEFRQEQALPALSAQLTRGAAPPAARDVPLHIQMHPPPPHVPPVAWSRSGDADRDGANSSSHSFVAFSPGPGASGTPLEPEGVYAQPWRSGSAREAGPADISPKRYAFSTRRSPLHQIDPEGVAVIPVDARVKRLQKVVDYGTDEAMNSITRRNRWMSVDLPGGTRVLRLNWVVSVLATSAVWATVVFVVCLAQTNVASGERILQTVAEFDTWRLWVSQNFAWLYVASRNAWLFFLVWLSLSKYGSVVLGKQAERPYFDDVSWFAMVVCCGLGMGVWSHGVSTSMALFRTRDDATSLFNLPFQNDDGRAQQAVFMTIYLYGLHAWAVYVLVALAVGVVAYRWDMPVSLRTAFYPLLGDVINGLLGDVIEACAVASTTFAFSTALGFGAEVILAGMRRLDCAFENVDCKSGGSGSRIMAPDDSGLYKGWQVGTMWVISTVVLAAQMLGLRRGIRALAVVTFIAGTCLILILLFLDNSWYILNSIVQAFGHYLHYFVLISFRTDATEQLAIELQAPGAGMANLFWDSGQTYETLTSATGTPLGGKGGADYFQSHGADWMHSYTMFYWAWWVSWAPAVGVFLARISRGRSIRSVVIGALFGPVAYTSVCLVVFASLGIRMQRMVEVARAVPADVDPRSGHTVFINCSALGYSGGQPLDDAAYKLAAVGLYPLACREQKDQVIDLLQPYGPHLARFLGCLTVVVMALYLITALNTASFVHDAACASGMIDTPYIQRSYWALTHVGCATVLVIVGGQPALLALQSLSLSLALPYTLGLSLLCTALLRACKFDDMDPLMHSHTRFLTGLFDWTEGFKPSLARRASPVPVLLPTVWQRVSSLILAIPLPFVVQHEMHEMLFTGGQALTHTLFSAALFTTWVGCLIGEVGKYGRNASYIGWCAYVLFALHQCHIRRMARTAYRVWGWLLEDFLACLMLYPFVASQLALQARCVDLENYPVLDPRQALQDLNASLLDTYEAERVVAEDTHEDDTQEERQDLRQLKNRVANLEYLVADLQAKGRREAPKSDIPTNTPSQPRPEITTLPSRPKVRMGSPPKNDWAGMQGNGEADADIETSRGAWGSAGLLSPPSLTPAHTTRFANGPKGVRSQENGTDRRLELPPLPASPYEARIRDNTHELAQSMLGFDRGRAGSWA
eukprot:Tamp_02074.p1 GENE.Tamp_02074~~Tamp_02074.p1  ORF type:complete len:1346 (-),score=146.09 Tamp_02074:609-4121(-)